MRDPEYREAMRAQQKMNLVRSNPTSRAISTLHPNSSTACTTCWPSSRCAQWRTTARCGR